MPTSLFPGCLSQLADIWRRSADSCGQLWTSLVPGFPQLPDIWWTGARTGEDRCGQVRKSHVSGCHLVG